MTRLGGLPKDSKASPDSRNILSRSCIEKTYPSVWAKATKSSLLFSASYFLRMFSSAPPAINSSSTLFFDMTVSVVFIFAGRLPCSGNQKCEHQHGLHSDN